MTRAERETKTEKQARVEPEELTSKAKLETRGSRGSSKPGWR